MKSQSQDSDVRAGSKVRAPLPLAIGLCLALFTVLLFSPVHKFQFVNLDDPAYVTANPHLVGGLTASNLVWALSGVQAGFWHPVTWWSHMLDVSCFGESPTGPHLVNLGLHVANVLLLFLGLFRWTGALWRSALVAALFAWHPLRVESVAWIAERKDVLSGFFFLLTLWAYAEWAKGEPGRRRKIHYALALVFFVLGVMSKPMLVTVPFVLLLVDFWPLGRFSAGDRGTLLATLRKLLREKIPFFVVTLGGCLVTVATQKSRGAMQTLADCPLEVRVENAVVSYIRYLGKALLPVNLATPYEDVRLWPLLIVIVAAVLLAAFTYGAVRLGRKHPFAPMGWFWFSGMLIPVIGIVQVGAQSMADRFTYLPLIGVFIVAVWGAEAVVRGRMPVAMSAALAALVLLLCAGRTRDQLHYWYNSETLLGHAVAVTRKNWIAEYNLAWELDRQGRYAEAESLYRQALAVKPRDVDTLNSLGLVLARQGKHDDAILCFEAVLELQPGFVAVHYSLARSLLQEKKFAEAIQHYRQFLQAHPEHILAQNDMGIALGMAGDLPGAVAAFREALRRQPDDAKAHFNLGAALVLQGDTAEARRQFTEALRLQPGWAEAESQLQVLGTNVDQSLSPGRNP